MLVPCMTSLAGALGCSAVWQLGPRAGKLNIMRGGCTRPRTTEERASRCASAQACAARLRD